ncbi:MAG: 1-acyl-sn-glycerol-3-phosphate acyltransferase [Methylococcales bacterium]|nr:1-acyl-sn-glycerol-3-phosphate acyltransferase [Methylococcales bacterium]
MNKKFNYYWRLFATAVSFTAFGLGGLLLWLLVYPILRLIPGSQSQKTARAQKSVHYSFYIFIGLMHQLGVMSYEIKGLEKLNRPGQLILANHPTLIDIVFIISRIPLASCIVKEKLWHNPFIKGSVINAGYISNGDSEKMIRDSVAYLKAGGIMVIFPEGTRTVPGKSYKFQRGAARIALQANTIVTPVTISCFPSTLTKQEKWYQIPDRQFHLAMQVGDDMVLDEFLAIEPKTIGVRRFNRYLQEYFSKEHL